MIRKPYPRRDMDDDYAPVDYTYMPSVSEGRRREQQKNIAKEPERAIVRHRASPFQRESVDAYGTRASLEPVGSRSTVAGRLPSMEDGPAPARSIAYPETPDIPDNPFELPAEEPAAPQRRRRAAERSPIVREDGSQFDPPAMAQLPEWYRVAQQNSMPRNDLRAPRVQAAPRLDEPEAAEPALDVLGRPIRGGRQREEVKNQPVDLYEAAGYPEALIEDQRQYDEEYNRVEHRMHHGAKAAVNRARQEEYQRSLSVARGEDRTSFPPSREQYAQRRALSQEEQQSRARAAARAREAAGGSPSGRGSAYAHASYGSGGIQDPHVGGYEVNPYARQRQPLPVEEEVAEDAPRARFSIPWLGIAVFSAAILAVALWLMQLTFNNRADEVIAERQQAVVLMKEQHPYEFRALIEREAAKNNLNPAFVAAIVLNESSFRTDAESNVGARGLMQVMEETAQEIGGKLEVSGYNFDMLYDAETNVTFGCYYLGQLSRRFRGDPVLVSAAYHAGATQVQNWLNTATYSNDGLTLLLDNLNDGPTKQYATRIKRDFAIYRRLYYENLEEDA